MRRGSLILGVDPGLSGAIGVIDSFDGKLLSVHDMPTFTVGKTTSRREINEQELARLIVMANPDEAVIEQVHAMPKQGVSGVFRMGAAFGSIKGVLAGLGIPFHMVEPQAWKKAFKLTSNKDESRQLASRVWPYMSVEFKNVKDDGRAEAALIAMWYINSQDQLRKK